MKDDFVVNETEREGACNWTVSKTGSKTKQTLTVQCKTQETNGLVHLDKSKENLRIHCVVSRASGILKKEKFKQNETKTTCNQFTWRMKERTADWVKLKSL